MGDGMLVLVGQGMLDVVQVADIPTALAGHAVTITLDNRALLCGGWNGMGVSAQCFIYDPTGSNGTWTWYASMRIARQQHAMDMYKGELQVQVG